MFAMLIAAFTQTESEKFEQIHICNNFMKAYKKEKNWDVQARAFGYRQSYHYRWTIRALIISGI
jgi:hypothetical protein